MRRLIENGKMGIEFMIGKVRKKKRELLD